MTGLTAALERLPVIGILRGCPAAHLSAMAAAAADAGLTALEVTLDSPEPFDGIGRLCANHPGLAIGAGTVRSADDVARAAAAGASFVVSPMLDPDVVTAAAAAGVAAVPGAATPTEIKRALDLDAALVKVFPARELGGPAYLRAICGPLGNPPLLPTGGVDAANAADFLAAGAVAIGVGGAVFSIDALRSGDVAAVDRRCRSLAAAIR